MADSLANILPNKPRHDIKYSLLIFAQLKQVILRRNTMRKILLITLLNFSIIFIASSCFMLDSNKLQIKQMESTIKSYMTYTSNDCIIKNLLWQVANNEISYVCYKNNEVMYVNSFFKSTNASKAYYSFVDMNESGSYELIIQVRPNYMQLVLHYYNGFVYGGIYSIREMNELAQNGLFIWAGGVGCHGIGRLEFINGRHYIHKLNDEKQYNEPLAIWKPLEIIFPTDCCGIECETMGNTFRLFSFRETWIDAIMTYEITHHDDYILSIHFTGEMSGGGVGARGFVEINKGLIIDLIRGEVLMLCNFVDLDELLENDVNNNFYLYNGSIFVIVPPPMGSTRSALVEIENIF